MQLWVCAHGGVSYAELRALEMANQDVWGHNWGSPNGQPAGVVPLLSLRKAAPSTWPWASALALYGNEPQMPGPDGDGYTFRAFDAGRMAGELMGTMPVGKTAIVGNFFCADVSKVAGTCYDGKPPTSDAGPLYWSEYMDSLERVINPVKLEDVGKGIHYYTRSETFDAKRCIGILEEYHADWGGPVYLTELGVEPYRFGLAKCIEFLDELVDWALTKPWMAAICWSEWPDYGSDARLWRNGQVTPLGEFYRSLAQEVRAQALPEPEAQEITTGWERVATAEFMVGDVRYQSIVRREVG